MAVISNLGDQPAQAGTTIQPRAIPSYMRPTKTSTQRVEDKPKSKVLKAKDLNQVQRVLSAPVLKGMKSTVVIKAGLVKGKGKEKGKDKDVKSGALASVQQVSLSYFSYDSTDKSRASRRHHKQVTLIAYWLKLML
jgi:hypothetical protein